MVGLPLSMTLTADASMRKQSGTPKVLYVSPIIFYCYKLKHLVQY